MVPPTAVAPAGRAPVPVPAPALLRVGTLVWLASELLFFGGLFAAWFGLRAVNDPWPPADVELAVARTGLFSLALLASSWTYHRAARAAEAGEPRATARWTLVTAALGLVFLANQVWEYAEADFGLSSHPFGSMFFVLTGFHGLHVLGGIVLMLVVLTVPADGEAVVASELYWHFVDVVWVALFTTVYLVQ